MKAFHSKRWRWLAAALSLAAAAPFAVASWHLVESPALYDHLSGEANLLVMPNLDAANIAYNLVKMTSGEGVTIGPILLGAAKPVQVLTSTATVRRLVNMTALTEIEAAGVK